MKRLTFVAFCLRVLKLRLTNAQRVLVTVAIDGVEPSQLSGADRELARAIFGNVDTVSPQARRVLVWLLGRASGKSTLVSALLIYVAVTASLERVGPGMTPAAVALAPRQATAKLVVSIARALVRSVPELEALVAKDDDTKDGFSLVRGGRHVRIAAFAASKGGINVRGFDLLALVLDEAQLFQSDSEFAITDRDSYNAALPRLLHGPGHHAILISTPWPVPTLMGELFDKNFGAPSTAFAALGSTLLMRDHDPQLAADIEAEREADPENTARERDCIIEAAGALGFFDADSIAAAIDGDLVLPATRDKTEMRIGAAMDLGLSRDSAACAAVGRAGEKRRLLLLEELKPSKGKPLKLSAVMEAFAQALAPLNVRSVAADAWAREPAREYASAHGLTIVDAPAGQAAKAETYVATRKLFREQRVTIPNYPRLVAQLRAVIAKPVAGGGVQIVQPRRVGLAHGDLVSALVLALHQVGAGGGINYAGFFGAGGSLLSGGGPPRIG